MVHLNQRTKKQGSKNSRGAGQQTPRGVVLKQNETTAQQMARAYGTQRQAEQGGPAEKPQP